MIPTSVNRFANQICRLTFVICHILKVCFLWDNVERYLKVVKHSFYVFLLTNPFA